MGIKLEYRKPGIRENLEQLIVKSLDELPRKDINIESEAARKQLAKYLSIKVLDNAEKKNWWDTYSYNL